MIDSSIFRAYDIRGNTERNLNNHTSFNLGYHFAQMSFTPSNNRVVIGYDGRMSSPWLYESLVAGLAKAGAEITSIGLATTPLLYFADHKLSPACSIMITGSHNPKNDNGFKLLSGGNSFYGERIQALLALIKSDEHQYTPTSLNPKRFYNVNVKPFYIDRLLKNLNINPDLKIVWDAGNGAAGMILPKILEKLPNKNFIINDEVDGTFPNHHPDPTVSENLTQLINAVEELGADLGVAFDGDADRIGIISKNGKIIYSDQLMCIYAKDLLNRKPGSSIIGDVKCSKILFDYISSLGGRAIMWKTGHAHIKAKMKESGAEIAGEMSGHIFFSDAYLGFDDGIYASLRLLDILSRSGTSLEEMLQEIPKAFNTPEIRIEVDEDKKFKIVEMLKQKLLMENVNFCDIDGIRVDKEKGWWLLRASNTQAALIARCEADSSEELKILVEELNLHLREYSLVING
ncbi:MAG: phosphomannomutase/phosphoglucomutase [Alphaproteobacteria bacterium]|nr:phosphomannomutase/phosphoglucomutase [Alphaproteobacteria bacterium]